MPQVVRLSFFFLFSFCLHRLYRSFGILVPILPRHFSQDFFRFFDPAPGWKPTRRFWNQPGKKQKPEQLLQNLYSGIPPNSISVKWVRFFVSTEPEMPKISEDLQRSPKIPDDFRRSPKIFRRLSNITEDLPTTSEDNRSCWKIFVDFKTGPTIFKGFPTNLEHY